MSHNNNKNQTGRRDVGEGNFTKLCLLTDVCENKIMSTEASSDYTYPLITPSYLKGYHRCDQATNLDIVGEKKKSLT